ncbi:MAG: isoprenoid biosynthesis protein ElbB [Cytophagales bacterium]|nr:MAG: isoprenoid biosynthesis protein ElbB [Cytophagales bacterium]TAF59343.1 MAG: isoprenoid biosynthesis protein ElbB [Cytophagales bacterium]
MKVGVLLSGCGVYDGAEIQESVFVMLALAKAGAEVVCIAPDVLQHHVINHTNGQEMSEQRNVWVEAARIARGKISKVKEVNPNELTALVLPGGFGVAKNFSKWAFEGPKASILPEVQTLILQFVEQGKPIAALCMAPTTVALALSDENKQVKLTVGNITQSSPYPIEDITKAMKGLGANAVYCDNDDMVIDDINNILSTPCYMMDASIQEIYESIERAMYKLVEMAVLYEEN